jgi:hypothetical protein
MYLLSSGGRTKLPTCVVSIRAWLVAMVQISGAVVKLF